jgi:hypothetical protein
VRSREQVFGGPSSIEEADMRRGSRIFTVAMLCFAFMFLFLPAADAYLDPGTGSFMFQALVGAILAASLAVKVFWRRILSLVSRREDPVEKT